MGVFVDFILLFVCCEFLPEIKHTLFLFWIQFKEWKVKSWLGIHAKQVSVLGYMYLFKFEDLNRMSYFLITLIFTFSIMEEFLLHELWVTFKECLPKPYDNFLNNEKNQYWSVYWWNVCPLLGLGTAQKGYQSKEVSMGWVFCSRLQGFVFVNLGSILQYRKLNLYYAPIDDVKLWLH